MKICLLVLCIASLFHMNLAIAAAPTDSTRKSQTPGFGNQVTDQLGKMAGKWEILDAQLRGGPLPKDQFESLEIDDSGFILRIQKRKVHFKFISYDLDSNTFLARSVPRRENRQLMYEVRIFDGTVKIRYCINGAHLRPDAEEEDSQMLVQRWRKKPQEKKDARNL
ncbi:MAG TPA: hypothetical protein DDW52_06365 [Planctomycetaceae bacterium]|nr:hypothetical protein [Planctomycetaceae bacterium]